MQMLLLDNKHVVSCC